jgi:hypothetical protein
MSPQEYVNEVRGEIQVARLRAIADVYAKAYACGLEIDRNYDRESRARAAVQDFIDMLRV